MIKRIAIAFLCMIALTLTAKADTRYVLVGSELNVRSRPSLGSSIHGRLFTGDAVEVSRTYNGWCFLEGLPSEEGCGWVSASYLVVDPVTEYIDVTAVVSANGRVAVRNSVDGQRKSWVNPGDIVHVYGSSDSWSVTDRGYVKTEYLVFN